MMTIMASIAWTGKPAIGEHERLTDRCAEFGPVRDG
jgi:hypothetical protein